MTTTTEDDLEQSTEPVSLAEAAASALSGIDGGQGELEGTQATKVKFVGMQYDAFEEDIRIGDEMSFAVRARCVGIGDELIKVDQHTRHYVKMEVLSCLPQEN